MLSDSKKSVKKPHPSKKMPSRTNLTSSTPEITRTNSLMSPRKGKFSTSSKSKAVLLSHPDEKEIYRGLMLRLNGYPISPHFSWRICVITDNTILRQYDNKPPRSLKMEDDISSFTIAEPNEKVLKQLFKCKFPDSSANTKSIPEEDRKYILLRNPDGKKLLGTNPQVFCVSAVRYDEWIAYFKKVCHTEVDSPQEQKLIVETTPAKKPKDNGLKQRALSILGTKMSAPLKNANTEDSLDQKTPRKIRSSKSTLDFAKTVTQKENKTNQEDINSEEVLKETWDILKSPFLDEKSSETESDSHSSKIDTIDTETPFSLVNHFLSYSLLSSIMHKKSYSEFSVFSEDELEDTPFEPSKSYIKRYEKSTEIFNEIDIEAEEINSPFIDVEIEEFNKLQEILKELNPRRRLERKHKVQDTKKLSHEGSSSEDETPPSKNRPRRQAKNKKDRDEESAQEIVQ